MSTEETKRRRRSLSELHEALAVGSTHGGWVVTGPVEPHPTRPSRYQVPVRCTHCGKGKTLDTGGVERNKGGCTSCALRREASPRVSQYETWEPGQVIGGYTLTGPVIRRMVPHHNPAGQTLEVYAPISCNGCGRESVQRVGGVRRNKSGCPTCARLSPANLAKLAKGRELRHPAKETQS